MNKRLWVSRVEYSAYFSCANSWWHKLWHSFKVEERGPGLDFCAHEIWTCSCGKRWKVDSSWIGGVVYVDAEELKEEA